LPSQAGEIAGRDRYREGDYVKLKNECVGAALAAALCVRAQMAGGEPRPILII
jgi:hypothetical protein